MLPFTYPLQCCAHRSTYCTIACRDFAKTYMGHGVPNLWKNPHVEIFPERALVWDICPERSYAWCWALVTIRVRGVTMCQLRMDISEVRGSQCMFGVWGVQQGGCSSKQLLESRICFLLHSPPSSSRPCLGNTVWFFLQSISLFHLTTL